MFRRLFGKKDKDKEIKKEEVDELLKTDDGENKEEVEEKIQEEDENPPVEDETNEENTDDSDEKDKGKTGVFSRFFKGLEKTRKNITNKIDQVIFGASVIDDELYESIEDILIMADIGASTTMEIVDRLEERVKEKKIQDPKEIKTELNSLLKEIMTEDNLDNTIDIDDTPLILLVVGVNGVGKTTSIGKLAKKYTDQGKSVLLAAADTFRAAAIEQLGEWANRVGVDMIAHKQNADPGAIVFDAIAAAKSRNTDIVICDTAGRLHNKKNLMNELNKIYRIIEKQYPEARLETLLVLDATTGQNAMNQVEQFKETADISGVILTKMDGTAKGGVVIRIQSELKIPIKYIGLGEGIDDLKEFSTDEFIDSII